MSIKQVPLLFQISLGAAAVKEASAEKVDIRTRASFIISGVGKLF